MKFEFFPEASRVVEFVFFPSLATYEKSDKAFGALNYELLTPGSVDRWGLIAEELAPFKEGFDQFTFSGYSYYFDLMYQLDLKKLRGERDYLRTIQALGRDELTAHLRDFLDRNLDITIPLGAAGGHDTTQAFQILSTSSLDNNDKWKLLAILEDPELIRDRYVQFMEEIIPIFSRYYGEVVYAVAAYARQVQKELETGVTQELDDLARQFLIQESIEALENSETLNFFPLGVLDYSFNMISRHETTDLFLGINVLDYHFKLSSFEERIKEERITVFKNLSDKTRYDVLKLIARGDSSTKVLAEKLGVTSAAISYHLKQLTNDRLIQFDANRRKNGYRINRERMNHAIAGLLEDLDIK